MSGRPMTAMPTRYVHTKGPAAVEPHHLREFPQIGQSDGASGGGKRQPYRRAPVVTAAAVTVVRHLRSPPLLRVPNGVRPHVAPTFTGAASASVQPREAAAAGREACESRGPTDPGSRPASLRSQGLDLLRPQPVRPCLTLKCATAIPVGDGRSRSFPGHAERANEFLCGLVPGEISGTQPHINADADRAEEPAPPRRPPVPSPNSSSRAGPPRSGPCLR